MSAAIFNFFTSHMEIFDLISLRAEKPQKHHTE